MLLRDALGETLRDARTRQNRTLRDVATAANVSLGYLSEVERGRKEASSELLASICDALDVELAEILSSVSHTLHSGTVRTDAVQSTSVQSKSAQSKATRSKAVQGAASSRPVDTSLRIVLPYDPRRSVPVR